MMLERVSPSTVTDLVRAALQAPSGDNCQPWRFVWAENTLHIRFRPERGRAFMDVSNMASYISLGASVRNVLIAASRHHLEGTPTYFPDPSDSLLFASIRFAPTTAQPSPFATAIEARCVNRRPYDRVALPADVRRASESVMGSHPDVRLSWTRDDRERDAIAQLGSRFDQFLFQHRQIHDDLYRWVRWTPEEARHSRDGMPLSTLEIAGPDKVGFQAFQRWALSRAAAALGAGRLMALRANHLYRQSSAFALFTVPAAHSAALARGGEALQDIWLWLTLLGYSCQPVTGFMFLSLRHRFANGDGLSPAERRLVSSFENGVASIFPPFANETPVMILRVGRGPEPSGRALRLDPASVLTFEEETSQ